MWPLLENHGNMSIPFQLITDIKWWTWMVIFRSSCSKKNDHIIIINLIESSLKQEVKEIRFIVNVRNSFDYSRSMLHNNLRELSSVFLFAWSSNDLCPTFGPTLCMLEMQPAQKVRSDFWSYIRRRIVHASWTTLCFSWLYHFYVIELESLIEFLGML